MGVEYVVCDLCGADDYAVLFHGKDRLHHLPGVFTVVKCRNCRLVYLNPRPDSVSLPDYYPQEYSPYGHNRGIVGKVQGCLRKLEARRIRRLIPAHGRVLEVGCASGGLLVHLRDDQELDVVGIEMSSYAASLAQDQHGLNVHTGTLFDAPFKEGTFDAVVMRHVIEHFPSARQALQAVASLLKPGGVLYLITPNYDSLDRRTFGPFWYDYDSPRHMSVFSVMTLKQLLVDTGFEVQTISHSMVPNDWIHSVKYVLEGNSEHPGLARFFTIKNPLMLMLFMPFGVVQKLLKMSGRIRVVAVKK